MARSPEAIQLLVVAREARELAARLEQLGCAVAAHTARPAEAEHLLQLRRLDVMVLDADLVEPDFLDRVRHTHPSRAFVGWLASASSSRAADLLEAGVDEVVHDGMGERELRARILGAAERRHRPPVWPEIALGRLTIDDTHADVRWDGDALNLSRREREVLIALAESAGKTVRRESLYKRVWGYSMARGDRSVDVNVKRLRSKLAAAAGKELQIKTQPGIGYRLELADSPAAVTSL